MKTNETKQKKQIERLAQILIPLSIFVICSVVFVGNELLQNSRYYLRDAQRQEQRFVDLLAVTLDEMYQNRCSEAELVDYLQDHVPGSGNNFYYLVHGSVVVFARDRSSTETLGEYRDLVKFRESYADEKVQWTSAVFGDEQYQIGSVYSENYLLKQAKVTKHTIYILLPLAVSTAVYFILVVVFSSSWLDMKRKNRALKEKTVEDAVKIETLLAENEQIVESSGTGAKRESRIYSRNVVTSLLKKSEDPALFPVTILLVRIREGSTFSYGGLYSLTLRIQEHLNSMQMVAQSEQNELTVLMYHTTREEGSKIWETCAAELERDHVLEHLTVDTAVISTEDRTDGSLLQYYQDTAELLRGRGVAAT